MAAILRKARLLEKGEIRFFGIWAALALGGVNFVFLVQGIEQIGHFAGRFAGAQQQNALRIEREVHHLHRLALQYRLQVDQQVAATDQFDIGERRVLDQIVLGEHHHFTDGAVDLIAVFLVVEILGHELRRQVGDDAIRINAAAGAQDGVAVDVGGEDLDVQPFPHLFQHFAAQHGQRISFLAGGTAGHPEAHLLIARPFEQARQMLRFQFVEHLAVAKKAGDSDQQFAVERVHFARIGFHVAHVIAQILKLVDCDAPFDASSHGAGFVIGEIHPGALAQQGEDTHQIVFVRQQHGWAIGLGGVGVAGEGQQFFRHFVRGQDAVGQSGGDGRPWHAVEAGGFLALHHHHPAGFLDRPDAAHSVAAGTREDDADRLVGLIVGQRAQEYIDG